MPPPLPSSEPPSKGPQICKQRHEETHHGANPPSPALRQPPTPYDKGRGAPGGTNHHLTTSATKAKHPPRGARAAHDLMALLLDGQRGARGEEKSEMDEPRCYLHGMPVGLCRRRQGGREEKGQMRQLGLGRRPSHPWGATWGPREKTVL
jgi:hypothetical protein